jgi:hypothetical protein
MIAKGVDRELYAVAVTPSERDAILSALEDPPDGLVELRGVLARDQRDRRLGRLTLVGRGAVERFARFALRDLLPDLVGHETERCVEHRLGFHGRILRHHQSRSRAEIASSSSTSMKGV